MGTKTIGLREDVYERLHARKRDGESFTDLVDRLIDESETHWEETFGTLPREEADDLEVIAERSRSASNVGHADRQRDALAAFGGGSDDSSDPGNEDEGSNDS
ncbi:antitoxin VapB family protein [Natrarchaeobius sp. A-rgal3]|uniref:antitoxin VapB family protein n=1 Tax=Natrarchaeobius versutus TaxID=1679078 RepID=UPI003510289F